MGNKKKTPNDLVRTGSTLPATKNPPPHTSPPPYASSIIEFEEQEVHLHVGPIPSPRSMQHYEQAVPGLGNQIMEMAKTEQRHQHQQDTKDFVIRLLGLIFAALMVFAVIGVSGYLIAMGNATQGTIFGSVSLVSLVGLYVYALRVVRIDRDKLNDTNGNNENEA